MRAPSAPDASTSRLILGILSAWVVLACGLGLTGWLVRAPAVPFGALIGGLTALAFGLAFGVRTLRAWMVVAPLRPLVLVHLVRLSGLAFFGLYLSSELPAAFAIPAGVGDASVALLAIPLALWGLPATTAKRWTALLLWNIFGTADLLLAVARGLRLGLISVELMVPLSVFPLVLIPLVVVPLGLVAHAAVFVRLWTMRREVEGLV